MSSVSILSSPSTILDFVTFPLFNYFFSGPANINSFQVSKCCFCFKIYIYLSLQSRMHVKAIRVNNSHLCKHMQAMTKCGICCNGMSTIFSIILNLFFNIPKTLSANILILNCKKFQCALCFDSSFFSPLKCE